MTEYSDNEYVLKSKIFCYYFTSYLESNLRIIEYTYMFYTLSHSFMTSSGF